MSAVLQRSHANVYDVHMKRLTASEARRNWFRLLDEVAAGQVVLVERNGRRIVIRREQTRGGPSRSSPDYSGLLRSRRADDADSWTWSWKASGGLRVTTRKSR